MRCLNRNKVKFFYALYEGREFITDEYGNVTGEYMVKYGNPVEFFAIFQQLWVRHKHVNLGKAYPMTK